MNLDFQPPAQNVFVAAVQWLEGTLLGSVATAVAVIAVGCIGFLLLSGRIDVRRAAQVIFGCFILFGASTIAAGIVWEVDGDGTAPQIAAVTPQAPVYAAPAPTEPVKAVPYDPYAGAAIPARP